MLGGDCLEELSDDFLSDEEPHQEVKFGALPKVSSEIIVDTVENPAKRISTQNRVKQATRSTAK